MNEHPLTVAVSGSRGLVGSALTASLSTDGHRVLRLVRRSDPGTDEVGWDPADGRVDAARLGGASAVVHLAGENVAAGRWSLARKERIRSSRVEGTRLIAEALAGLDRPPPVWVNASAIGFYGDRGDERLDETSAPGDGFLAETCVAWEAATAAARAAGVRVVLLRIGIVLDAKGGALARMLTPFRWGLGGRLGHGRQFMSWITLDDLVGVLRRALVDGGLEGAVNAVAPRPVTNAEFTRTLGRVLRRPTLLPAPALAIRLLLGEMGQELLLAGARVRSAELERCGFETDRAS
jgi:uncharacterized protein (TIGR01777 family)